MRGPSENVALLTASAQVDYGRSFICSRPCFAGRREGLAWTGLCAQNNRIKECHQFLGSGDASKGCRMGVYLAGSGWSFRDTGSGSSFAQSAFRGFEKFQRKGTTPMALERRRSQSLWHSTNGGKVHSPLLELDELFHLWRSTTWIERVSSPERWALAPSTIESRNFRRSWFSELNFQQKFTQLGATGYF